MGWGWGWGGDAITSLEVAHMVDATPRQHWCVNFRFFMQLNMVRCCCVHLHMAEYDSSKFVERRRHVLAHEDVSVGISSTHPSAHQSQSAMLPNRMHHLEDKLTEPNPTNCLPHVAARTPANVKART